MNVLGFLKKKDEVESTGPPAEPPANPKRAADDIPDKDWMFGRYYRKEDEDLRHHKECNEFAEDLARKATDTPRRGEDMNVDARRNETHHHHAGIGGALLAGLGLGGIGAGIPAALMIWNLLNPEPTNPPAPGPDANTEYQFQTVPGGSMPWPND